MILHCRDFTIGKFLIIIIMGHDRATGKRYFIQEVTEKTFFDLPPYLTSTPDNVQKLEEIFWIERGKK